MLELLFEFLNFLKATSYAGTRTSIRTGAPVLILTSLARHTPYSTGTEPGTSFQQWETLIFDAIGAKI